LKQIQVIVVALLESKKKSYRDVNLYSFALITRKVLPISIGKYAKLGMIFHSNTMNLSLRNKLKYRILDAENTSSINTNSIDNCVVLDDSEHKLIITGTNQGQVRIYD